MASLLFGKSTRARNIYDSSWNFLKLWQLKQSSASVPSFYVTIIQLLLPRAGRRGTFPVHCVCAVRSNIQHYYILFTINKNSNLQTPLQMNVCTSLRNCWNCLRDGAGSSFVRLLGTWSCIFPSSLCPTQLFCSPIISLNFNNQFGENERAAPSKCWKPAINCHKLRAAKKFVRMIRSCIRCYVRCC